MANLHKGKMDSRETSHRAQAEVPSAVFENNINGATPYFDACYASAPTHSANQHLKSEQSDSFENPSLSQFISDTGYNSPTDSVQRDFENVPNQAGWDLTDSEEGCLTPNSGESMSSVEKVTVKKEPPSGNDGPAEQSSPTTKSRCSTRWLTSKGPHVSLTELRKTTKAKSKTLSATPIHDDWDGLLQYLQDLGTHTSNIQVLSEPLSVSEMQPQGVESTGCDDLARQPNVDHENQRELKHSITEDQPISSINHHNQPMTLSVSGPTFPAKIQAEFKSQPPVLDRKSLQNDTSKRIKELNDLPEKVIGQFFVEAKGRPDLMKPGLLNSEGHNVLWHWTQRYALDYSMPRTVESWNWRDTAGWWTGTIRQEILDLADKRYKGNDVNVTFEDCVRIETGVAKHDIAYQRRWEVTPDKKKRYYEQRADQSYRVWYDSLQQALARPGASGLRLGKVQIASPYMRRETPSGDSSSTCCLDGSNTGAETEYDWRNLGHTKERAVEDDWRDLKYFRERASRAENRSRNPPAREANYVSLDHNAPAKSGGRPQPENVAGTVNGACAQENKDFPPITAQREIDQSFQFQIEDDDHLAKRAGKVASLSTKDAPRTKAGTKDESYAKRLECVDDPLKDESNPQHDLQDVEKQTQEQQSLVAANCSKSVHWDRSYNNIPEELQNNPEAEAEEEADNDSEDDSEDDAEENSELDSDRILESGSELHSVDSASEASSNFEDDHDDDSEDDSNDDSDDDSEDNCDSKEKQEQKMDETPKKVPEETPMEKLMDLGQLKERTGKASLIKDRAKAVKDISATLDYLLADREDSEEQKQAYITRLWPNLRQHGNKATRRILAYKLYMHRMRYNSDAGCDDLPFVKNLVESAIQRRAKFLKRQKKIDIGFRWVVVIFFVALTAFCAALPHFNNGQFFIQSIMACVELLVLGSIVGSTFWVAFLPCVPGLLRFIDAWYGAGSPCLEHYETPALVSFRNLVEECEGISTSIADSVSGVVDSLTAFYGQHRFEFTQTCRTTAVSSWLDYSTGLCRVLGDAKHFAVEVYQQRWKDEQLHRVMQEVLTDWVPKWREMDDQIKSNTANALSKLEDFNERLSLAESKSQTLETNQFELQWQASDHFGRIGRLQDKLDSTKAAVVGLKLRSQQPDMEASLSKLSQVEAKVNMHAGMIDSIKFYNEAKMTAAQSMLRILEEKTHAADVLIGGLGFRHRDLSNEGSKNAENIAEIKAKVEDLDGEVRKLMTNIMSVSL